MVNELDEVYVQYSEIQLTPMLLNDVAGGFGSLSILINRILWVGDAVVDHVSSWRLGEVLQFQASKGS